MRANGAVKEGKIELRLEEKYLSCYAVSCCYQVTLWLHSAKSRSANSSHIPTHSAVEVLRWPDSPVAVPLKGASK